MGVLRLRPRRGFGLGLSRNLNPRNREKVLATLYPPLAEDNEEADLDGGLYTRRKSKTGTHTNEGASESGRNRSSASRTSASASDRAHHHQHPPTPATQSPNAPQPPNQDQGQARPRSRHPSHHLPHPHFARLRSLVRVPSSRDRGSSIWRMRSLFEREGFLDALEVANSRLDGSVVATYQ